MHGVSDVRFRDTDCNQRISEIYRNRIFESVIYSLEIELSTETKSYKI